MAILTQTRAKFIRDAFESEGGFSTGSYLDQFPREDPEVKYPARKSIAVYDNFFRPAVSRYCGYLSRRPATRVTTNPILSEMLGNIDRDNTSAQSWMMRFSATAKPYGSGIGLVDMPAGDVPASMADQLSAGAIPYFSYIDLKDVNDYSTDETGHITSLQVSRYEYVNQKSTLVTRSWDTESWSVIVDGGNSSSGEHGLGRCPAVDMSETYFPNDGEFSGVADLQKELFNMHSEARKIMRDQSFGVLCYPVPIEYWDQIGARDLAETISTENMVKFVGNTPPEYVTPESGPSETYSAKIDRFEHRIREITHTIESGSAAESGVSREIKFQDLNGSLSSYAESMETFERRMWNVACAMIGVPEDEIQISWPREYKIVDIESELRIIESMQLLGFPEAAIMEKKRLVLDSMLPSADSDTAALIETQLAETSQVGQSLDLLS